MTLVPEFFGIELEDFADLAYMFMIGIPGWASSGFCMMGPDELRKQRWTYVKHWLKRLKGDLKAVHAALEK